MPDARPWWEGRLLGFDLETTAPDPEEARIVSAAVVLVGGGQERVSRTWLVDPGVPIPPEATEVHGITTEQAQELGRPFADVAAEIVDALLEVQTWGAPLVAFNARYDLTVLARELGRLGGTIGTPEVVVDPLVIDKHLDRYRKGSRKLDAICAHYGATLEQAHDADSDALAACRAAWVLGAKGKVVRRVWDAQTGAEKAALVQEWEEVRWDLVNLHDAQRRWAREQAIGLADYFRRNGQHEDAEGVRVEWPVIPLASVARRKDD